MVSIIAGYAFHNIPPFYLNDIDKKSPIYPCIRTASYAEWQLSQAMLCQQYFLNLRSSLIFPDKDKRVAITRWQCSDTGKWTVCFLQPKCMSREQQFTIPSTAYPLIFLIQSEAFQNRLLDHLTGFSKWWKMHSFAYINSMHNLHKWMCNVSFLSNNSNISSWLLCWIPNYLITTWRKKR